jgi:6-phosphofructo-2-kinase/fructose-2,6-biphosphatase 4
LEADSYKADASLSEQGEDYAKKMTERLLQHRESEKQAMIDRGETDYELKPLTVWTSTRRRTVETAKYLYEKGYKVRQRSQMSQLNPGVCEKMSERRIREEYPDEVAKHELDPYHHRYPRAEVSSISASDLLLTTRAYNYDSPTMTLRCDSNQSFWNLNGSKRIFSS